MPRWDFECPSCGHREEHTFPSFAEIKPPVCSHCDFWYDDPVPMERQPSAGNFVLKGPGFYKNDYPSRS